MTLAMILATVIVTAFSLLLCLWVPVTTDEAWFLLITRRMQEGRVLYREVFYGAGPIPVWIALAAVKSLRPQMLVLRALGALYAGLTVTAAVWVVHAAGGGAAVTAATAVGTATLAGPAWSIDNHYSQLARLTGLVMVASLLESSDTSSLIWLALAGVMAGITICSKQNVGIVLAIAGCTTLVIAAPSLPHSITFVTAAVVTTVLILAPLVRQRAFGSYIRRAYLNKTTYLATGVIRPLAGAALAWQAVSNRCRSPWARFADAVAISTYLGLVLVPLSVAAAIAATGAGMPVLNLGIVAILGLAYIASITPRSDLVHVQQAFPLALTCAAAATVMFARSVLIPAPVIVLVVAISALWAATAVVASLVAKSRLSPILNGPLPPKRDLPFFRGLPVLDSGASEAAKIRDIVEGPIFILRSDAAFWYLVGSIVNPTPYDFPLASTFGPHGQNDVVNQITSGEITYVCLPAPTTGPLRPSVLEDFILSKMTPVANTAAGQLYRYEHANTAFHFTGAAPKRRRTEQLS